nr:MAG TPA: hypothetical protein [Caudoviricetes sp.]
MLQPPNLWNDCYKDGDVLLGVVILLVFIYVIALEVFLSFYNFKLNKSPILALKSIRLLVGAIIYSALFLKSAL